MYCNNYIIITARRKLRSVDDLCTDSKQAIHATAIQLCKLTDQNCNKVLASVCRIANIAIEFVYIVRTAQNINHRNSSPQRPSFSVLRGHYVSDLSPISSSA